MATFPTVRALVGIAAAIAAGDILPTCFTVDLRTLKSVPVGYWWKRYTVPFSTGRSCEINFSEEAA